MLRGLLKTMRPKQWAKNVFLYAALVFDEKLFQGRAFLQTTAGVALFCLLSGCVYLINDLVDMDKDRQHPKKRTRPLASGQLKPAAAIIAAAVIAIVALPASFWLDFNFGVVATLYLGIMVAYSLVLKNVVILVART